MREHISKKGNSLKKEKIKKREKEMHIKKYEKCWISLIIKEMQTKIRDSFHQLISIKSSLRLSLEKMWGKACKLVQPSWRGFVSMYQKSQK